MKRIVILILFLLGSLFLADARNQPECGMPSWEETTAEEIPQWDTPDRTLLIMTGISRPAQPSVRTPLHRTPRHHHRIAMRLCCPAAHSGANLTISSNRKYFFAHAVLRSADYYVVALRRLII